MQNDLLKCAKCRKEHLQKDRVGGELDPRYSKIDVRRMHCPFCNCEEFFVIERREGDL